MIFEELTQLGLPYAVCVHYVTAKGITGQYIKDPFIIGGVCDYKKLRPLGFRKVNPYELPTVNKRGCVRTLDHHEYKHFLTELCKYRMVINSTEGRVYELIDKPLKNYIDERAGITAMV